MSDHTPGPWSINKWTQPDSSISIGAVGTPLIARVQLRDVSINGQKANANLIAAAPELLEAAQEMADLLDNLLRIGAVHPALIIAESIRSALPIHRAAIAKAKGGAE